MRLPTVEEMTAFSDEERNLHAPCEASGVCVHQQQARDLDELLKSTYIVEGLYTVCVRDNPTCFFTRAELRYCTIYGFLLGMMLGFKLAEQDQLERSICGESTE
jgi:hypothetical protein